MQSSIPVPTDNIYKFYALFGLLLFIFCCASIIYVTQSSNKQVYSLLVELEDLRAIETPTSTEQLKTQSLERLFEIGKSDKKLFLSILNVLGGMAAVVSVLGFFRWQTQIQPVIDETHKVQLEIAKLQLLKLQAEQGQAKRKFRKGRHAVVTL